MFHIVLSALHTNVLLYSFCLFVLCFPDLNFPDQESSPCPRQWRQGVLTTGPPREVPPDSFPNEHFWSAICHPRSLTAHMLHLIYYRFRWLPLKNDSLPHHLPSPIAHPMVYCRSLPLVSRLPYFQSQQPF